MLGLRLLAVFGAFVTVGCATAGTAPPKLDLTPAREAVAKAREVGAEKDAPEVFRRAEGHLKDAEAWAGSNPSEDRIRRADTAAQLAQAEALCALDLARQNRTVQESAPAASSETAGLAARLRKAEDEQRRLEERIAFLSRELELTENEVIRTKSRLKGNETKAEASSAIAEARILARRLTGERSRAATLARCNELIAKAEELLQQENFGAAAFFAQKAQDTAAKAQETSGSIGTTAPAEARPAPRSVYVVKVSSANIRKGPDVLQPVVGRAPKGATLAAALARGDWIQVTFGAVTGWVHRSVVDDQ